MTTIIGCIRKNEKWIDLSYYVLYAILYLSALVGTTTFMDWEGVSHVRNLFYMGATAGMMILWGLGLALQENCKINMAKILIFTVGFLQFALGGGSSLILILTILIGATDRKSARIILWESLMIGVSLVLITVFAATRGWIVNDVTYDGRHSFGFTYYSHLSDKLLYYYLIFFCLYCKQMTLIGYILSAIVICINYHYTLAKTVTICFLLYLVLCAAYKYKDCKIINSIVKSKMLQVVKRLCISIYFVACIISFASIFIYRMLAKTYDFQLTSFVARLYFGSEALNKYRCTLFGQKIYEGINTALKSVTNEEYFYLDNTYVRLFVITGIITLLWFMVYTAWLMTKVLLERRYYMLFALLITAIGGLSETYTINFYYNIILILGFAHLGDIGRIIDCSYEKHD